MAEHDRLGAAVRGLLARNGRRIAPPPSPNDTQARLEALERDVQEVRTRVNALFFAVMTVAVGDLVARAVLP